MSDISGNALYCSPYILRCPEAAQELAYDTEYLTPYGTMSMKIVTNSFEFNMSHDEDMKVMAEYELEMDGQVLSDSMIIIEIKKTEAR